MHSLSLLNSTVELQLDIELVRRLSKELHFTKQLATNKVKKYAESFDRLLIRKIIIEAKTTPARLGAWRKTYYTIDRVMLVCWLQQIEELKDVEAKDC